MERKQTSRGSRKAGVLLSIPVVMLLLLFWLSLRPEGLTFIRFFPLKWERAEECFRDSGPPGLTPQRRSLSTWKEQPSGNRMKCLSAPLRETGELLLFEYAGTPGRSERAPVALRAHSGARSQTLSVSRKYPERWKLAALSEDEENALRSGEPYRIVLRDGDRGTGWVALRDRVNVFSRSDPLPGVLGFLRSRSVQSGIMIVLTLAMAFLSRALMYCSTWVFVLILSVTSLGLFFRPESFFYHDEWHVLERFRNDGISAAWIAHNEHFIPLFLLFYRLELFLFGDRYALFLLVSVALHVINAMLLGRIVDELSPRCSTGRPGNFLALLFLLNGLHTETLHWAFLQGILIGHMVILGVLLAVFRLLRSGDRRNLAQAALGMFIAPFIYGGAIILPFWVLGIVSLRRQFNTRCRSRGLVVSAVVALIFSMTLYSIFRKSAGHGIDEVALSGQFVPILHYALFGAEYGTLLRGLGLFPISDPATIERTFAWSDSVGHSTVLISAGLLVSAVLGLVAFRRGQDRPLRLSVWALGHLILLSQFGLIGVGRARFGISQALEMRYQYGALIGLTLILLPLVWSAYRPKYLREQEPIAPRRLGMGRLNGFLFLLFVALYVFGQLSLTRAHQVLADSGKWTRVYVSELVDWFAERKGHDPAAETGAFEGLEPLLYTGLTNPPTQLTPLLHPELLYDVLRELNPRRYPARYTTQVHARDGSSSPG